MTPTLATIRFESAYLLCHVNAIDAHPMRIQSDSLWMRIETGLHVNAPLGITYILQGHLVGHLAQ